MKLNKEKFWKLGTERVILETAPVWEFLAHLEMSEVEVQLFTKMCKQIYNLSPKEIRTILPFFLNEEYIPEGAVEEYLRLIYNEIWYAYIMGLKYIKENEFWVLIAIPSMIVGEQGIKNNEVYEINLTLNNEFETPPKLELRKITNSTVVGEGAVRSSLDGKYLLMYKNSTLKSDSDQTVEIFLEEAINKTLLEILSDPDCRYSSSNYRYTINTPQFNGISNEIMNEYSDIPITEGNPISGVQFQSHDIGPIK